MGTIVVGYVPKAEGEAALDRAVAEALLRDSSLVVVSSHRGGPFGGDEESDLDAVRTKLADSGVEHEVRRIERGVDPAEDLITTAEDVGADLLVIGLRRRTPVGKLVLGSNAQSILLSAPCSVLAVKAED